MSEKRPPSYRFIRSPLPEHAEKPFAAPERLPPACARPTCTHDEGAVKDAIEAALARLRVLELLHPDRAPRIYRRARSTRDLVAAVDEATRVLGR